MSEKSHNTQLDEMFEHLRRYGIAPMYGMVGSQILAQILPLVMERVPLDCEEVPFLSWANTHFPYALLCSILCTKPEVALVLVWSILEYSMLALIFVPKVATSLHLLEAWSSSDSMDKISWLRSSSTIPRRILMWLSIVALKEFSSEVVILGCTIPSGDIHELDALTSQ
jgi:hypothetical protein